MRAFAVTASILAIICTSAFAQTKSELPPNTIDCNGFQKLPNGGWYAKADNPSFDLGNSKHITMTNSTFGSRAFNIGGYDLADVLDRKCGTSK